MTDALFEIDGFEMNPDGTLKVAKPAAKPEAKKVEVKTITKSDIYNYEKCPLAFWKSKRARRSSSKLSKDALITIRAKELVKRYLFKKSGENPEIVRFSNRLAPDMKFQAQKAADRFISYFEKEMAGEEVISIGEMFERTIPELNISVKANVDLVLLADNYLHVIELHRGHIKKELDNQALLYAWLVGKTYGLSVLFERTSMEEREAFTYFLKQKDLEGIELDILEYLEEIKMETEGDKMPLSNPSAKNCLECPFFKQCMKESADEYEKIKMEGIQDPEILVKEINQLKTFEVKRKDLEAELKEILEAKDEREIEGDSWKASLNVSQFFSLGRKVKKEEIAKTLLEKGLISEEKYSLLNLKVDDFLDEIKEAFELSDEDVKKIERKTLSIKTLKKK